jgi:hypothetical protein
MEPWLISLGVLVAVGSYGIYRYRITIRREQEDEYITEAERRRRALGRVTRLETLRRLDQHEPPSRRR